jgi:hypothetical protein
MQATQMCTTRFSVQIAHEFTQRDLPPSHDGYLAVIQLFRLLIRKLADTHYMRAIL